MSSPATRQPSLRFIDRHGHPVDPGASPIQDRASVHIAFQREQSLLLIRPFFAPSTLECVGGGIHPGETLLEAAQRETLEEIDERIDFRRLARKARFRQTIGFFAEDVEQFWRYRMEFWLVALPPTVGLPSAHTAEGNLIEWVPLSKLGLLPINAAHLPALQRFAATPKKRVLAAE